MNHYFQSGIIFLLVITLFGCSAPPPPQPATPQIIYETLEIIVTQPPQIITQVVRITATPPPSPTPPPPTPTPRQDWVDYGGICLSPGNMPSGVQVTASAEEVNNVRKALLEGLWRLLDASGAKDRTSPRFNSAASLVLGTLNGTPVSGPVIPVGDQSNPRLLSLADPLDLWTGVHPGEKIDGVVLDKICVEYFDPADFPQALRADRNRSFFIVNLPQKNNVTTAIFALEQIFGSPHVVIKLLKTPFTMPGLYKEFTGFRPENTAAQNAQAANDHLGVLIAILKNMTWSNHDTDKSFEYGFSPRYATTKLPASAYQFLKLFGPTE